MPKVQQRWFIFFRPHLRQHSVLNAVTVVAEILSQAVDTPGANTATAGQSVDSEDSYYSAESCGAIAAADTQGYMLRAWASPEKVSTLSRVMETGGLREVLENGGVFIPKWETKGVSDVMDVCMPDHRNMLKVWVHLRMGG